MTAKIYSPQGMVWDPRIESPDLAEEEFTNLCAEALLAWIPGVKVKVDCVLRISWDRVESETEPYAYFVLLENAWMRSRMHPGSRMELLDQLFASAREYKLIEDRQTIDASDVVVPLLRTSRLFETGVDGKRMSVVAKLLAGDLHLVYGCDWERSLQYLAEQQRRIISLDDSALFKKACNNLRDIVRDNLEIVEMDDTFGIVCDETYESSVVFLEEVMADLSSKIDGRMIFSVPARHLLMISGDSDLEVVERMGHATKKFFSEGDHIISDRLYRYDDGVISLYQ